MTLAMHYFGDPVLREKFELIPEVSNDIRALAKEMIATMRAQNGIGLAAQQIGRTEAICVVELPAELDVDDAGERENPDWPMPLVLLNPEVKVLSDEAWTREEGCLSFPDMSAKIQRPYSIEVRYMNLEGQSITANAHGMLARVIQHEVDHLNGVLFIDRMSHVKRLALKGRLRKLREQTVAQLSTD